ncbi:hypothetical protein GWI33_013965 [Rhynchophorus ferrugineus]|uniref:Uncharacterized protein n=1 Tax=Rhynchophorus ferrugineus TaxID=354439 RepID=A0A834I615_RHYFE|nr:hypothetical protein GWI33_013965 [Rhynchophorus ferrugineus]
MIQIIILLLFMDYWSPPTQFANGELLGDHICQIEITEPVEVLTWELKNKTVRTYKWCMNVPPRCSKYDQQVVNQTKTIMTIALLNSLKSFKPGEIRRMQYVIQDEHTGSPEPELKEIKNVYFTVD